MRDEARASRAIPALFVLALGVRWGWVLLHASSGATTFPDEEQYWNLARSLAAGRGLVDEFGYRATFTPLYPAFLSLFVDRPHGMLIARLMQAALGAGAVIPIFVLARRLGGGRAAVVSGLLVAVDPFLVFGFANLLLTETIFTTLLCGAVLAAWPGRHDAAGRARLRGPRPCPTRSSRQVGMVREASEVVRDGRPPIGPVGTAHPTMLASILAGVLFGAAIYMRPSVAAFVPLWAIAFALAAPDRFGTVRRGAIVILVVVLLLLPWAVRNRIVVGQWVWLTTRSGISLYDGLGPRAAGGSDLAYTKTMPNVRGMSETQWSCYFSREAWRIARDDPERAVRLAWTKFKRTWSFVPNEPGSRTPSKMLVSAVWMSAVLGLAVLGAFRIRKGRDIVLLLLPAVYFTLLHMVYVGSVRYRVPAMPMIYVLSGWAVVRRPGRNAGGAEDG